MISQLFTSLSISWGFIIVGLSILPPLFLVAIFFPSHNHNNTSAESDSHIELQITADNNDSNTGRQTKSSNNNGNNEIGNNKSDTVEETKQPHEQLLSQQLLHTEANQQQHTLPPPPQPHTLLSVLAFVLRTYQQLIQLPHVWCYIFYGFFQTLANNLMFATYGVWFVKAFDMNIEELGWATTAIGVAGTCT